MWAQLIKSRIKPGSEGKLKQFQQEMEGGSGQGRGPERVITMRSQKDPSEMYTLIIFENEEKARENEGSPEQVQRLERLRQIYDGQPEFVDLNVEMEISR